jgi:hypothetical protein
MYYILKGGNAMPNEVYLIATSNSVGEDKDDMSEVHKTFAVESCPAQCPTCQQPCSYTQGHPGLHHCGNDHDWT